MKAGRVLRILALALGLPLVGGLIPASPALALPEINLAPGSGAVGTVVTVSGSGFESFAGTDINIFFDGAEIAGSPITVPVSGSFSMSFEVPDDAEPGTVSVRVSTVIGGEVRKSFIIEEPKIDLDVDEGSVGTELTVDGRGFYAGGTVDIYYRKDGSRVKVGDEETDGTGKFSFTFPVPDSAAGKHEILAEDALDNSDTESFEVTPAVTAEPLSAAIGDDLTVTGTGFAPSSDVTVYFNNISMATDETNKYGSFETVFKVPNLESGSGSIEVEDTEDNRAVVAFSITAGAQIKPGQGFVGIPVIASGVGFQAGRMVTVSYDDEEVATAVPGDNGTFTVTFVVPPSAGGNHTVRITDGVNTATDIFVMETDAPSVPALLLPADDSRSEAAVKFDWDDVEDDSGVTYALQVATKGNFTAASLVLDLTGLDDSGYEIIEEAEELGPNSKESPYYWRVMAVDGAANASEWSEVSSFYVGSSFTLPETARRVLIGLAIFGAGFFGFWLGRRTAYARRT